MSPELVQEQPYDHRADLWSLGIILFELFVGQPPFYTNNIYTLISLIVKQDVQYPPHMSNSFRSFLSGLLNKHPGDRLCWPHVLHHPFIAGATSPTRSLRTPYHALRLREENPHLFLSVLPRFDVSADSEVLGAAMLPRSHRRCVVHDNVSAQMKSAERNKPERSQSADAGCHRMQVSAQRLDYNQDAPLGQSVHQQCASQADTSAQFNGESNSHPGYALQLEPAQGSLSCVAYSNDAIQAHSLPHDGIPSADSHNATHVVAQLVASRDNRMMEGMQQPDTPWQHPQDPLSPEAHAQCGGRQICDLVPEGCSVEVAASSHCMQAAVSIHSPGTPSNDSYDIRQPSSSAMQTDSRPGLTADGVHRSPASSSGNLHSCLQQIVKGSGTRNAVGNPELAHDTPIGSVPVLGRNATASVLLVGTNTPSMSVTPSLPPHNMACGQTILMQSSGTPSPTRRVAPAQLSTKSSGEQSAAPHSACCLVSPSPCAETPAVADNNGKLPDDVGAICTLTPCCANQARSHFLSPDQTASWQRSPSPKSNEPSKVPTLGSRGSMRTNDNNRRPAVSRVLDATPVDRMILPDVTTPLSTKAYTSADAPESDAPMPTTGSLASLGSDNNHGGMVTQTDGTTAVQIGALARVVPGSTVSTPDQTQPARSGHGLPDAREVARGIEPVLHARVVAAMREITFDIVSGLQHLEQLAREPAALALLRTDLAHSPSVLLFICDGLVEHPQQALAILAAMVHTDGDHLSQISPTGTLTPDAPELQIQVPHPASSDCSSHEAAGMDHIQTAHLLCCGVGQQLLAHRAHLVSLLVTEPAQTLRLLLPACRAQPALGAALATDERAQALLWEFAGYTRSQHTFCEHDCLCDSRGASANHQGSSKATLQPAFAAEATTAASVQLRSLLLLSLLLSHGSRQTRSVAVACALPHSSELARRFYTYSGLDEKTKLASEAQPSSTARCTSEEIVADLGRVSHPNLSCGAAAASASVAASCIAELLRADASSDYMRNALHTVGGQGVVQQAAACMEVLLVPAVAREADQALRLAEGTCFGSPHTRAADGIASLLHRLSTRLPRKHSHFTPLGKLGIWHAISGMLNSVAHAPLSGTGSHLNEKSPHGCGSGTAPSPPLVPWLPTLSLSGVLTLVHATHELLSKHGDSSARKLHSSGLLTSFLAILETVGCRCASSDVNQYQAVLHLVRHRSASRDGGAGAAAALLNAVSLTLYVPFGPRGERSAQALVELQQAMYRGKLLGALLRALPLAAPHEPEVQSRSPHC